MTNVIDLDAAPEFVLTGDGRFVVNGDDTPLEGSLREILFTVTGLLADAVDLDLPEMDMVTEQKVSAAEALKRCAEILEAYAGDFAEIARAEAA
ncbi:MAG: hypothetical protein LCH99_16135 [Proteobacteria bacterium]|nr:hypothetical protein [Pseudomonadota bacterium]